MDKSSINQKPIVIFISGHLDLTEVEFNTYYRPLIDEALVRGDSFVVGDARGTERTSHGAELNSAPVSSAMANAYLHGKTTAVTVYHLFERPRNNAGFQTIGGFKTDEARDAQMTSDSDLDIAWVRPGRENSGTQKNLDRRRSQCL